MYDIELQRKRKVGQTVKIPDSLDLSAYVCTDVAMGGGDGKKKGEAKTEDKVMSARYRLSSILYHKGNSADMGHYVAEVQNHARRKWFVRKNEC